jgi:hypothetical protein
MSGVVGLLLKKPKPENLLGERTQPAVCERHRDSASIDKATISSCQR